MLKLSLSLLILCVLLLTSCSSSRTTAETLPAVQVDAASHYRQHGDAASLRRAAAELKPGMPRSAVVQFLGQAAYSPTDNQDYYPSELRDENGSTLVLVVNYHPEGTAKAGTLEWFFVDYIGE